MGAGAAAVLEGLRALQPTIEARAAEMEEHGVPPELYDRLVATRCFEALVPAHLGGLDLSLVDLNEIVITASRADGSIGWLTMIGCHTPLVLSRFPSETVDELLANGLDVRARGSIAPKGVAVPVEGGYVVSGQWPFASGGPNPPFVAGHCLVLEEGRPKIGPDGVPQTLFALMPAEDLTFLDTWHVMGMKATDSCDVAAHEVFVPARRTFDLFSSSSSFSSRLGRLPLRAVLATGHASVAVGIAMGALDDITTLSATKRAAMNPTARLAEDPVFQHTLGEQHLRLRGARAFLDSTTADLVVAGEEGRELTPVQTLEARTMAGFVTAECVKVVDTAYTLAGSASLYERSPLQRRLRDMHVATQHVAATSEGYRTLGALLAGEPVPPAALF